MQTPQRFPRCREINLPGNPLLARWPANEGNGPSQPDQFILSYLPYVNHFIHRLGFGDSASPLYWDLMSQGLLGVLEAKGRYDPLRGVKFSTFAIHLIRGRILDFLRETDWLPRSARRMYRAIQDTKWRLVQQLHHTPSEMEVALLLGQDPAKVRSCCAQGEVEFISLDTPMDRTPEGNGIHESIADEDQHDPADIVCDKAFKESLTRAIQLLPDMERWVLTQYYFEKQTLKIIGAALGVSESRVCQLKGMGERRLRGHLSAWGQDD